MSHEMEMEDFVRLKDCELASLREELSRERARRIAAEESENLAISKGQLLQKENTAMRKQLQSWADYSDKAYGIGGHEV